MYSKSFRWARGIFLTGIVTLQVIRKFVDLKNISQYLVLLADGDCPFLPWNIF